MSTISFTPHSIVDALSISEKANLINDNSLSVNISRIKKLQVANESKTDNLIKKIIELNKSVGLHSSFKEEVTKLESDLSSLLDVQEQLQLLRYEKPKDQVELMDYMDKVVDLEICSLYEKLEIPPEKIVKYEHLDDQDMIEELRQLSDLSH